MLGGQFFRRGPVLKDDGSRVNPIDLEIGKYVKVLARDIYLTDADEFTRSYMRYE